MTHTEYTTKLEEILDEQFKRLDGTEVLPIYNRPTAVGQALQAICLLNEEAIGAETDPMKLVTDELLESGHSHYTDIIIAKGYAQNELRQELKSVIGVSNE